MKMRLHRLLSPLAAAAFAGISAHAQTFTWLPTAGTGLDWNLSNNWDPSTGFPNAAGAVANVNSDLTQAQTIRLREAITLGQLFIGDAAAAGNDFAFTIANATAETFALTFDSGVPNTSASITLNTTGTPTNVLNVPINLTSDLSINLGNGTQRLTISGVLDAGTGIGARNVTVTNGTQATNQLNLNGNLSGSGIFTNNSNAAVIVNGTKDFTGVFVLNKGSGGSNTGSLTVTGGSIANASEVIINGALSNGTTQSGGSLHSGDNSMRANPGQRLTQNRITMNSGSLTANGQTVPTTEPNPLIQDTVANFDLNSGYSHIVLAVGTNSTGTRLNITTLERSPGATAYVRSNTLGGTARLSIANASSFLTGGGGAEGTATMSIIPWIGANNTGAGTAIPSGFATHTANGIRALDTTATTTEYANQITAGSTANINIGTVPTLTEPTTINALRLTSGGTSNLGDGQVLTIQSGGIFFAANNSTLGGSGSLNAGTIAFGSAEGVVWSNGTNTNTIGASMTGSLGLTKAGTGTLILTGTNSYSGLTSVSGGTLQVGDGLNLSNLGLTGDVTVANGATLSLLNDDAIADTAILRLQQFGLLNGKLNLALDVNETVGSLFLGDAAAVPGTYGSTLSGATFQNDTFFAGLGTLTVVPEPTSLLTICAALVPLMGLRRRRSHELQRCS
jgi:autotransporter-associated beta strand protein